MAQLAPEDRRAYEANVWKVYAFHFLMFFQLWWSIWVLYLQDFRGFSLTQITALEALFWAIAVLAEVPTGAIADRFGRKTSLALSAAFTTLGVLFFGLASAYWLILVSYLAWAVGAAFLSGAEYAMLFESLKATGREQEFQRVAGRFVAIFPLAALCGGILGGFVAAATDLSFPIILSAAIVAPAFGLALSMKEPALPEGEVRQGYFFLLREGIRLAARTPTVRSMLMLSGLVTALTFGPLIFMQPFLDRHGVDVAYIGVIQTPVRLLGVVGALIAHAVAARLGTRATFLTAPVVMGASFFVLAGWDSVFAFAAFPLVFFMNALLLPPATDYINQRIPNRQRATVLSLRQLLTSIAVGILAPTLGASADAVSLRAVFAVAGAVAAAGLTLLYLLWLHADEQEVRATQS